MQLEVTKAFIEKLEEDFKTSVAIAMDSLHAYAEAVKEQATLVLEKDAIW